MHFVLGHAQPVVAATDGPQEGQVGTSGMAVATVDGCNAQGAVVGHFCMNLAVEKVRIAAVYVAGARS